MHTQRKRAFTVVELAVVIVVIGILTSIVIVSYRNVQRDARNEKRKVDAIVLKAAVDDYYADHGSYPMPDCSTSPGTADQCWRNEAWELLRSQGYLRTIPQPETTAHSSQFNLASDGNANYGWLNRSPAYGIYVPREGIPCKTGKNVISTWWGSPGTGSSSVDVCDF